MSGSSSRLSEMDSKFIGHLRGLAILLLVFGHVGGFWVFRPYSSFLQSIVPLFFFLAGAVAYYSYQRSTGISEYLHRRLIALLVPYFLLCVVWLVVFIARHGNFPGFTWSQIFSWLMLVPVNDQLGFPIGQVWFLHTLLIISVVSPLFFVLYQRHPWILGFFVGATLAVSGIQSFSDIHHGFVWRNHNFYKPAVHSFFYILGFAYFTSNAFWKKTLIKILVSVGLILSAVFIQRFHFNMDYEYHTFSPDLYYVAGSGVVIALLLMCQTPLIALCRRIQPLGRILNWANEYTFPIYLIHTLAIYLAEAWFGLVHPQKNVILWGILKYVLVLVITAILAIPFARLSIWLTRLSLSGRGLATLAAWKNRNLPAVGYFQSRK